MNETIFSFSLLSNIPLIQTKWTQSDFICLSFSVYVHSAVFWNELCDIQERWQLVYYSNVCFSNSKSGVRWWSNLVTKNIDFWFVLMISNRTYLNSNLLICMIRIGIIIKILLFVCVDIQIKTTKVIIFQCLILSMMKCI